MDDLNRSLGSAAEVNGESEYTFVSVSEFSDESEVENLGVLFKNYQV